MAERLFVRGAGTYGDAGSGARRFVSELGQDWDTVTIFHPASDAQSALLGKGRLGEMRLGVSPGDPIDFQVNFGPEAETFLTALFDIVEGQAGVDLRVVFHGNIQRTASREHVFKALQSENGWTMDLEFDDGSVATLRPPGWDDEDDRQRTGDSRIGQNLDRPELLLEPITRAEFEGTEAILGFLTELAQSGDLDDDASQRVLDLADYLREERNNTEPEKSLRWKLVGAVRSIGRALTKFPMSAYWTTKLVMLVNKVGWDQLGSEFRQFFQDLP